MKRRKTYEWWNRVRERVNARWVEPGDYVSQILSEHGGFSKYLCRFGMTDNDRCECGGLENVNHVLFECERWRVLRDKCMENLRSKGIIFNRSGLISKEGFAIFREFVEGILRVREIG